MSEALDAALTARRATRRPSSCNPDTEFRLGWEARGLAEQNELYTLRAYLAKTLDNVEGTERPWTITDVSAFINDALTLEEDAAAETVQPPIDRKALRGALANVLCNAMNFPPAAVPRILGADMQPLIGKVTDAVIAHMAALEASTKPRTVITLADLQALPRLTAIRIGNRVWQKLGGVMPYREWQSTDGGFALNDGDFVDYLESHGPAEVVFTPAGSET